MVESVYKIDGIGCTHRSFEINFGKGDCSEASLILT